MTDLYAELEVDRAATPDQIKAAYRKRAKVTHPDAGGDAEAFARASKAMAVLSDPEKRQRYDETGTTGNMADDIETAVMNMVDGLLTAALDAAEVPEIVDIADLMRKMQAEGLRQTKAQLKVLEGKLTKLEKVAKRFSSKTGDKMINTVLERKIAAIRKPIEEHKTCIKLLGIVGDVLKGYSFLVDRPASRSGSTSTGFGRFPGWPYG